jgi:antitoxin MazE
MEIAMKVSKWGNSLAIRLPAELVEKLGVKEGDEIDEVPGFAEEGAIKLRRKRSLEEMWARLSEIRKKVKVPVDYKFDRDKIHDERLKKWLKDE